MNNKPDRPWIAKDAGALPDFIIGGAMKSGTTTLHEILASHPDVYIPDGEVHFFDIDNILEHGDFLRFDGDRWIDQDLLNDPGAFWQWYEDRFQGAQPGQLKGEDSTTYLASPRAARRIAMQPKPIKLIFILRNPVDRAWSQYWHMIRSGRTWHTFEDVIVREPDTVLRRSLYEEQLRSFYERVSPENILVISFEALIREPEKTLAAVCDHIGVDYARLAKGPNDTHANEGMMPLFPLIQRLKNRMLREAGNMSYLDSLPVSLATGRSVRRTIVRLLSRAHRLVNPLVAASPPPMKTATRLQLERFFIGEMAGLDELTGQEIMKYWFREQRPDS